MSKNLVQRPLWRLFPPGSLRKAIAHAQSGGISVIKARAWYMIGDAGGLQGIPVMIDWALRAVECDNYRIVRTGPLTGLVKGNVTVGWRSRVEEWAYRDRDFEGSTHNERYACIDCGACCSKNHVVLDEEDYARFIANNREDLLYQPTKKTRLKVLPLDRTTGNCLQLKDNMCLIYDVRPNMCRDFVAGSEHCLTSREEMYGHPFTDKNTKPSD